jgi:uncharacterized protein
MGVRSCLATLTTSMLLCVAAPASAQFSDSYSFLKAMKDGDSGKALEFVNKPGSAVLSARDRGTGEGALHFVVKRHDQAWLNFLLAKGAETEVRDNDGTTPLLLATRLDDADAMRTLLQAGARADSTDSRGETPLMVAVHQRSLPAIRLLLAAGADPRLPDRIAGKSAMDYAQEDPRGGTAMVKLLEVAKPAAKKVVSGPVR